jgi:hypothetical protein
MLEMMLLCIGMAISLSMEVVRNTYPTIVRTSGLVQFLMMAGCVLMFAGLVIKAINDSKRGWN